MSIGERLRSSLKEAGASIINYADLNGIPSQSGLGYRLFESMNGRNVLLRI